MTSKKAEKAVEGHKCMGAKLAVRVACECGWQSGNWTGDGARASAYGEWRYHRDEAHKQARAAEELE